MHSRCFVIYLFRFLFLTELVNLSATMSAISVLTKKGSLLNELQKTLPNISFHLVQNAGKQVDITLSHAPVGNSIQEIHNLSVVS